MAKRNKRAQEEPRELTRKEVRQSARDRDRNRKIYTGVGIAIGLALLVIVFGLISEFVARPNSTVATVAGEEIVTRDFWKRVRLQRSELVGQLVQMQQLEQQFGGQGFFTNQINQVQATLNSPFSLGVQVLDQMINEKILAEEAVARSISVSDEEIDEALREEIAASQGAVTIPQATSTAEASVAETATAESWTPTPVPTIDVSGVVTATATPVPTPEPLPTRPLLVDADYTEGLATLENNIDEIAGLSLAEYREVVRNQLLASKLSEVIGSELVTETEEQVNARHILLRVIEPTPEPTAIPEGVEVTPTEEPTPLPEGAPTPMPTPAPRGMDEASALAEELLQRINEGGEDFATLAAEYSEDPGSAAQGGDLGWFGPGVMVEPFETAAFALAEGEVSEPIETSFGVHLIEVVARDENRPKDAATIEQERGQAFQDWLREQVIAREVERPDDLTSSLPRDLLDTGPVIQSGGSAPVQPQHLP